MASGQPEVAAHVTAYQGRMNSIIVAVMRGQQEAEPKRGNDLSGRDMVLATLLQQIWFASLVAWSAGLFNQNEVNAHMKQAIELLLSSPKAARLRVIGAD